MGSLIIVSIAVLLVLIVCTFIWKLSKWLLIPLRITIFLVLLWIAFHILTKQESIQPFYRQVKQSSMKLLPQNESTLNSSNSAEPTAPAEETPADPQTANP